MRKAIFILAATLLLFTAGADAREKTMVSISQTMASGKKDDLWPVMRCSGFFAAVAKMGKNSGVDWSAMERLSSDLRRAVANTMAADYGGTYQKYMPRVNAQVNAHRREYTNWLQTHYLDKDPVLLSDGRVCKNFVSDVLKAIEEAE
jgi:hypothetical protein